LGDYSWRRGQICRSAFQVVPDPRELVGRAWKGRYRGQKQKWFAFRFVGDDGEIDILHPAGGHEPEFVEGRWEPMANLPNLVVPFKRTVYERVVREFSKFTK
jgi:putative (di)nucleoside polyphosphate hydrolase